MANAIAHRPHRVVALIVAAAAAVAMLGSASSAEANWWYTKSGAQRLARDYVSRHYANTYYNDLTARCHVQGGGYDRNYKYHTWICVWYDSSDDTYGEVKIKGSDAGPGAYHGSIVVGSRALH